MGRLEECYDRLCMLYPSIQQDIEQAVAEVGLNTGTGYHITLDKFPPHVLVYLYPRTETQEQEFRSKRTELELSIWMIACQYNLRLHEGKFEHKGLEDDIEIEFDKTQPGFVLIPSFI